MYELLKEGQGHVDEYLIAHTLVTMVKFNFIRTPVFDTQMVPLYTKYIRTFNRENVVGYTDMIISAAQLGVEDEDFWRAAKEKLVMERLDKFIAREKIPDVIKSFAIVGQADENTLSLLGEQVIKHKRFITEGQKTVAKQGFQIAEIGFAEFKRALDDDEAFELDIRN